MAYASWRTELFATVTKLSTDESASSHGFGNQVIWLGDQTLHGKSYPSQGLENRVNRRGIQTPWCGLQASPRLGEVMRRADHDPSRCPNPIMPPAKGDLTASH